MWHHRVGENQPAPLILTLGPDPGATLTMYMLLGAIARDLRKNLATSAAAGVDHTMLRVYPFLHSEVHAGGLGPGAGAARQSG